MRELEIAAMPVVGPMVAGTRRVSMDGAAQLVVSSWIVKTLMIVEQAQAGPLHIAPRDRHWIAETQGPPPDVQVFIGWTEPRPGRMFNFRLQARGDGYLGLISACRLVGVVVSKREGHAVEGHDRARTGGRGPGASRNGRGRRHLIQVNPSVGDRTWPPERCLSADCLADVLSEV
jgi:hypothetical protein